MYKVLFLSTPSVGRNYDSSERYKAVVMPYGLLSICTYLEANLDVEIELIDLNTENNSSYLKNPLLLGEYVKQKGIDVVGISAMYSDSLSYVEEFANAVKIARKESFVFAGGISVSNQYKQLLEVVKNIDAVCIGEGELPILNLLRNDLKGTFLKEDSSWVTHEDCFTKNTKSQYLDNLDDIPAINYSYVDVEQYSGRLWSEKPIPVFPMHATRGCPFNCIFCCASSNHGKKVRYMSPERFVSDVKKIVQKYGAKKISIDDDQFLLNQERAKTILNGLKELDISVEFPSGLSVRYIDDEMARLMCECNVGEIPLAIESGSERMLKEIIDKPLKVQEIKPAVEALRRYGIGVKSFFIMGIPGERPEDREASLKLMEEVGFDWNNIYIAMPLPGSRLYDICIENGYVDVTKSEEGWLLPDRALITAPYIEPNEISTIVYRMNLKTNFVNNYAYKTGNYILAEKQFSHISTRYPKHAFAHYFLAKTMEKLNREAKQVEKHKKIYQDIITKDCMWEKYAKEFGLE